MPHRNTTRDRVVSGLVVFLAEALVAIAAIGLALAVALVATVIV